MRFPFVPLLAILGRASGADQVPFRGGPVHAPSDELWKDLNARPDANSTGHLIFDTMNSLLQHWPNTRYRNGHNIIPGTVAVGTLLYHGSVTSELPTRPEWTATDPEHSFPFCAGPPGNESSRGCWHLTMVVTQPLKVLYFDGSSAANIRGEGSNDAEDLLIWGKVDPDRWPDERERINDICGWGKEFEIGGYVRMEMDFEIMLCNFSQSVDLVSADYLAAWWPQPYDLWNPNAHSTLQSRSRHILSPPEDTPNATKILAFELVRAGSWHNRYPGETRVTLDFTRFVSFYDTALAPSLIAYREGKERWDHRAQGISPADLEAVKTRLTDALAPSTNTGSGVDWQTLYRVILDRYADRLELLVYLLNTTTPVNLPDRARLVQIQLRAMLTPYILHSARPIPRTPPAFMYSDAEANGDAWAVSVWRGCATKHTAHIHGSTVLKSRLTLSESLLLGALDETNREICRVVVRMWVAGVYAGFDPLILLEEDSVGSEVARVVSGWREDAQALTAWLDWGVWVKCRPACGFEEMCYLPTWPFFFWGRFDETDQSWKRPQPRCIRQFEPYSML
ncbi:hypothetical protein B0H19DRAFT_1155583 [Mycena capillaripes]|nr:hypothetical protein B0H19DRAFT_1155583 [Mycena capillaripes]